MNWSAGQPSHPDITPPPTHRHTHTDLILLVMLTYRPLSAGDIIPVILDTMPYPSAFLVNDEKLGVVWGKGYLSRHWVVTT